MNYFELFELAPALVLEPAELATRYRTLQQRYHPDRFAAAPDAERLQALQQAAEINAAYQVLKDSLARAEYLLAVRGHDIRGEQQTLQDPEFLMQQMELREAIDEAEEASDPFAALDALAEQVKQHSRELEQAFNAHWAAKQLATAKQTMLKMRFYERLLEDIRQREERLEDSL